MNGEVEDFDWNRVIEAFVNAFESTFATSKKAHFDCVSPKLRVVDGARSRWSNLLLLDAVIYLLEYNEFNYISRRAFNQQLVLYNCIKDELKRANPQLFAAYTSREMGNYNLSGDRVQVVIHNLRQPWTSATMLKRHLLADPTAKSRCKYLGILEGLFDNETLAQRGADLRAVFCAVVDKVVYSLPLASVAARSTSSRTSTPSYDAQSELSSNDTGSLMVAMEPAPTQRARRPRLPAPVEVVPTAVGPRRLVAPAGAGDATAESKRFQGRRPTSLPRSDPPPALAAGIAACSPRPDVEHNLQTPPPRSSPTRGDRADGDGSPPSRDSSVCNFDLGVFDDNLTATAGAGMEVDAEATGDGEAWEYLNDWAWESVASPRCFLAPLAPLEHPTLAADHPVHPHPRPTAPVPIDSYPQATSDSDATTAPDEGHHVRAASEPRLPAFTLLPPHAQSVLSPRSLRGTPRHTPRRADGSIFHHVHAVPFPDPTPGSLYARRSAFSPSPLVPRRRVYGAVAGTLEVPPLASPDAGEVDHAGDDEPECKRLRVQ